MPLPVSGAISFNNINVELGVAGTTQASLGQASYRTLAGVPSGQISMSNFYGKANEFAFAIASNQTNANLRTLAINAGWNGTSRVVATINSGIYVSSNATGTPGLRVDGSFPGGVELVNNGFIIGMGGNGGPGGTSSSTPATAAAGGLALSVAVAVAVRNNGTIGGGGGGGGGGSWNDGTLNKEYIPVTGGGGGGGRTGAAANSSGGSGRSYGQPGTVSSAGAGGAGANVSGVVSGNGASGGGWGAAGGRGGVNSAGTPGGFGGAGGSAVSGNGNITWLATGTRLGAIT